MVDKKAASLNPENFTEGGGLIDDVDVTFKECGFEMFDYQGKSATPAPCLKIVLAVEEGDDAEQYYSMGSTQDWIPSEDGSQLVAVGKATAIRLSSNGGIFLKSLIDAGFPADKLGDDISILTGLQAHMIQVPAPARKGLKKTKEQEEREEKFGPKTILVVSEIKGLPWETKAPVGKPKAKAPAGKPAAAPAKAKATTKAAAPAPETSGDDLTGEATTAILSILEAAGTITKKELPAKLFQTLKADPNRNEIIKLVFNDEFLKSGPWEYADGTLIGG